MYSVAGKIAHCVREGNLPTVYVAGNGSIGTAAKSIAASRQFLQTEGRDIAFCPRFRDEDHGRALLALDIIPLPLSTPEEVEQYQAVEETDAELRVSSHSRHARVGGAIAIRVRENGWVLLSALGTEAQANAVMATSHACCYLAPEELRLYVQPYVLVTNKDGRELTGLRMLVKRI